jgi:hypothetical protein
MSTQPEFPVPVRYGGRLRFEEHPYENFKRALAGLPPIEREPNSPIRFIDASAVCADLAIDRRTLGSGLIDQSQKATAAAIQIADK